VQWETIAMRLRPVGRARGAILPPELYAVNMTNAGSF
jgi:hypothetical protein